MGEVLRHSGQFQQVLRHSGLGDSMTCSMLGLLVHNQLPEFTQTQVHSVSDVIQPSHPLSSPFPPTFNLSQHQGLFQWVCSSYQVVTVFELQLKHQSFQRIYSELISFRIDCFDLEVQRTLKSLLQHHNSKASVLWHSTFITVQLSNLYMTTGKTIALTT